MKQTRVHYKRHRSIVAHDRQPTETSAQAEQSLDDALQQTFPASDPVALTMPHDTSPARGKAEKTRR